MSSLKVCVWHPCPIAWRRKIRILATLGLRRLQLHHEHRRLTVGLGKRRCQLLMRFVRQTLVRMASCKDLLSFFKRLSYIIGFRSRHLESGVNGISIADFTITPSLTVGLLPRSRLARESSPEARFVSRFAAACKEQRAKREGETGKAFGGTFAPR